MIRLIFLLCILVLSNSILAHEKTWPAKRLQTTWSGMDKFSSKQVTLNPSQLSHLVGKGLKIGVEDKNPTFYFAKKKIDGKLKTIGVIIFIDEPGPNGNMEVSVAMGTDGKIKIINIWEHSENSNIVQSSFLNQFVGKSYSDLLNLDKGFQPAKDAKGSSLAVVKAAKKALSITALFFSNRKSNKN